MKTKRKLSQQQQQQMSVEVATETETESGNESKREKLSEKEALKLEDEESSIGESEVTLVVKLILKMIRHEPSIRTPAYKLLLHPFFTSLSP